MVVWECEKAWNVLPMRGRRVDGGREEVMVFMSDEEMIRRVIFVDGW